VDQKQRLVYGIHTLVADQFSDRDYAGFRYLVEDSDSYLDRKLISDRRGEGVTTHELRSKSVFGGEDRKSPEFIKGLAEAFGFEGPNADASARTTLRRLEDKVRKVIPDLETALDMGFSPPLTEKAQERMNATLQDLSRRIQR
jgi:hypothetical protein